MMRLLGLFVGASLVASVMTACSDDATDGEGDGSPITVTEAWAWSPMGDRGAVYFTVVNGGDTEDSLVAAAVADVDGTVEIHETTMSGGAAQMQPVDSVGIPAGETVVFEPGGYHVMIVDLAGPLEVGSTLDVTLTFSEAGDVTVQAEVRAFVEEDGSM